MTINVTPICRHADGFSDRGVTLTGRSITVDRAGVVLDGAHVIIRSRTREKGHPWIDPSGQAWTGFRVEAQS